MLRNLRWTLLLNCLFLIVGATLVAARPAAAQVVEIPDPNLESAIREVLELPDSTAITQQEMLRLERLTANGAQIENITGLEYATNLKSLVLPVNNIQDITPVKGLVKLESLTLRNNPITNLTPLANLTNLNNINIGGVKLSDITPLANLTELKQAWLKSMQIQDITPLANLTQLIRLNLTSNQIVDISPLANLTQLEELWLNNNRIVDVSPVANLTQLEVLYFNRNQVVDISPLANLTGLEELYIDRNQVVDVSPLANLTQLTDLTIANNPITDFTPLFGLNLQSLDVDIHVLQELASVDVDIPDPNLRQAIREALTLPEETPITQLAMLRLEKLTAIESQIENINGLEYAINLRSLALPVNQIHDITPLTNLVNLSSLSLRNNPIEDLSPLANLTKLTNLNLYGVIIKDLTPLSNLTQLRDLHLYNCQIKDITPLANLTQLVWLNLVFNQIVDISPLANLTQLEILDIYRNPIVDLSPLQGLSSTEIGYDEECLLPDFPIQDRIQNRSLPSTVQTWGLETVNQLHLSRKDRIAYHDIYWTGTPFGLYFRPTSQGYQVAGDVEHAIFRRNELLAKNPNMLFLSEIRQRDAKVNNHYPEDWPYWLKDDEGNPIQHHRSPDNYLIDITLIEVQDIIVQQAISVSKCGLYDGIFFDWWLENGGSLRDFSVTPAPFLRPREAERDARLSILQRIRANVPDDFLIVCNFGDRARPLAPLYVNGSFMETDPDDPERGYTREEIIEIETTLIWREENLREPQLNCLQGLGIPTEPHESLTNKRVMRLFTTMSLTLSNGYVHFINGILGEHVHFRYPFLDADLGQPVGRKAQRYQNTEGLFIREFTNGWAVYNRSGKAQTISLPQSTTGVSSGKTSTTHLLPDLDGEIYLKAPNLADVNGDGKVNILDLVQVANGFGKASPDPNGDGVVNILDLVFVAQQFSQ